LSNLLPLVIFGHHRVNFEEWMCFNFDIWQNS